ncbi:MAG: amino acid ABC transporter permease [Acholeplasmatales bacterium]|nr:MAG: amino acid ABC transporter permease [Acholeplasmatales bacterium]
MDTLFNYQAIRQWLPYIARGLSITLTVAFSAAAIGLIVGILINVLSRRKFLGKLAFMYVDIFRGTPVILQLSLIYYALPRTLSLLLSEAFGWSVDFRLTAFSAAVITFGLNSSAYVSEIIRSGVHSVDKGEIEAATALGVSKFHIYKDIILPIAFKNAFPAMMNEMITLVKESSIVSLIGLQDLMRRQQIVTAQTYMYFEPLIVVGIIYYAIVKVLAFSGKRIEMRLHHVQG